MDTEEQRIHPIGEIEQSSENEARNTMTDSQRAEYEKRLEEIRKSSEAMENDYKRKISEMRKLDEKELEDSGLISCEDVDRIVVLHAYCESCGNELVSKTPPMFNPFTLERICKHLCTKCMKTYNLEYAYPRLAFMGGDGKEIKAFTI